MPLAGALTRIVTARAPARPLAICRIGIGAAALLRNAKTVRDMFLIRGDQFVAAPVVEWSPDFRTTWSIVAFAAVSMGASVGLIAGYRARLCGFVVLGCLVLQQLADQNFWANHVYFLTLLVLLLSLSDSGATLSIDSLGQPDTGRDVTAWPLLLMKIQLSLVYFFTGIAKVNPTFLSGDVLETRVNLPGFLHEPLLLQATAVATVAGELFLAVAFWLAPLRHWAFLFGFLLHALIPLTMNLVAGLVAFSVMTLSVYVLFLDERERSRLVIWDDGCGFCRSWVRAFGRLDWLRIHRFEGSSRASALAEAGITIEDASEEIKVWNGRRVHGGFDAVREILKYLPIGFLWAQILALPPVRWVGVRAYRAVARRRLCLVSRPT